MFRAHLSADEQSSIVEVWFDHQSKSLKRWVSVESTHYSITSRHTIFGGDILVMTVFSSQASFWSNWFQPKTSDICCFRRVFSCGSVSPHQSHRLWRQIGNTPHKSHILRDYSICISPFRNPKLCLLSKGRIFELWFRSWVGIRPQETVFQSLQN